MTTETCSKCDQPDPGGPREIQFNHAGLTFVNVLKDGATCEPCAGNETRGLFDRIAQPYITASDGRPVVNWDAYMELKGRGGTSSRDLLDQITLMMVAVGVLSLTREGNWTVMSMFEVSALPHITFGSYFFTTRGHAAGFARSAHGSEGGFDWQIFQMVNVVSKQEVLAEGKSEE
jgi:hypothetical protein